MTSCLLVVDVQKGFINANTAHIPKLIEDVQDNYDLVIVTKFYNSPDSFFRTLINWHDMNEGSEDCTLAFSPRKDALIREKSAYSIVNDDFIALLNSRGVTIIDIAGIDTDICVMKCAVDLIENGKTPRVLSRLCASTAGIQYHDAAVSILRRYIGIKQVE